MKVFIGGDHAGFELKNKLVEYLKAEGHEVIDFGAFEFNSGDDYPDFVVPVAEAVAKAGKRSDLSSDPRSDLEEVRGIIIGGSGQGEAICANRFKGVRAVVFYGNPKRSDLSADLRSDLGEADIIKFSREHNDANILSLGARFLSFEEAKTAVKLWLETPFSGDERHVRRIKEIDDMTK